METHKIKQAQWRGKNAERRLAKKVNGVVCGRSKAVRLPSGKFIRIDCVKPCDVVTECFAFESKWLKNAPQFLHKVMTQAKNNCPTGLTPIGVIGDREQRVVYYVFLEPDFIDWHIGKKEVK